MGKLVSIIMPAYNCSDFIGESIRSVQNQSYTDWELIIVDDKSTDNTVEIINTYAENDDRIKVYTGSENLGPSEARNVAIRAANGNYIAFLDSDDIWRSNKLEKQLHFMEEKGCHFSFTAYDKINENGDYTGITVAAPQRVDYKKLLYSGDPIGNLTVMFDADVLGKPEVPYIRKRNDFALWLTMFRNFDYAYGLNESLASYRLRSGSISSNKLGLYKYYWQLYRKIEKMPFIKSIAAIISLTVVKQANKLNEYFQRKRFSKKNNTVEINAKTTEAVLK